MLTPIRLALLSTGRQGTYSLWSALNAHPRLFLPDFAYTDGLLLEGGDYKAEGTYGYQLHPPEQVPGMTFGCLIHCFSALDRMPARVPERLAGALAKDATLVLVTRDPAKNLVSMYHTHLELFFGRKNFDLIPAGHRLYDRPEPIPFEEYIEFAAYGVDYGQQLDDFGSHFESVKLFDFDELFGEAFPRTLRSIGASVGLGSVAAWEVEQTPKNSGGSLIHQRLFGMRSMLEFDGFQMALGFFGASSDPLTRGSLEYQLAGPALGGESSDLRAFTSAMDWFRLPLHYRRSLLEGEGWKLIEARYEEFQRYMSKVESDSAPYRVESWSDEALEAFDLHITPAATRFRERAPEASRSWSASEAPAAS